MLTYKDYFHIQIQHLLKLNEVYSNVVSYFTSHSNTTLVKVKWYLLEQAIILLLIQIQHLLKLNKNVSVG